VPTRAWGSLSPRVWRNISGPEDVVYLTGRDRDRVRAAAARIAPRRAQVHGEVLDVRDGAAVTAFADALAARHGGVDIVFSNAAARLRLATPWAELVGPFVDTNNLGATRMLRAFGPILRPGGRLLVVATAVGSLRRLPAQLHQRFDTDTIGLDDLYTTMLAWRDAVVDGRAAEEGWPEWINVPSKVAQVAVVRVLARERVPPMRGTGPWSPRFAPGWSTPRRRVRGSRT
jgi:carbonyl reductase 1